jgi:hypothetical protein
LAGKNSLADRPGSLSSDEFAVVIIDCIWRARRQSRGQLGSIHFSSRDEITPTALGQQFQRRGPQPPHRH